MRAHPMTSWPPAALEGSKDLPGYRKDAPRPRTAPVRSGGSSHPDKLIGPVDLSPRASPRGGPGDTTDPDDLPPQVRIIEPEANAGMPSGGRRGAPRNPTWGDRPTWEKALNA